VKSKVASRAKKIKKKPEGASGVLPLKDGEERKENNTSRKESRDKTGLPLESKTQNFLRSRRGDPNWRKARDMTSSESYVNYRRGGKKSPQQREKGDRLRHPSKTFFQRKKKITKEGRLTKI